MANVTSISSDRKLIGLSWLNKINNPVPSTTLLVISGPGLGLHRQITSYDATTNVVQLEEAADAYLTANESTVAVVSHFGKSLINGNRFLWAEVVQYYGNTVEGVHSDNDFTDCNVRQVCG